MLEFKLLEVSNDNSCIHVKANVITASYTKNVYINKVVIVAKDKYDNIDIPTEDEALYYDDTLETKELDLQLSINQLVGIETLENQLLYVYVSTDDAPTAEVLNLPCNTDNNLIVGVLFNSSSLYKRGMEYFKSVKDYCKVNKNFIDFILLYRYLQLAIRCNDLGAVNKIWDKLFINPFISNISNCNCYGI